jgi:hypothetical protein
MPKIFVRANWRPDLVRDSNLYGSCDSTPTRRFIDRSNYLFSLTFSGRLKIQIFGLAAAVILWGLGYKLSFYHDHHSPPATSVAKLWVDPRGSVAKSGMPAAIHLKAVQRASDFESSLAHSIRGFPFSGDSVISVSPDPRQSSGRLFKLFRSPPPLLS